MLDKIIEYVISHVYSKMSWQIFDNFILFNTFLILPFKVKVFCYSSFDERVNVIELHPLLNLILD